MALPFLLQHAVGMVPGLVPLRGIQQYFVGIHDRCRESGGKEARVDGKWEDTGALNLRTFVAADCVGYHTRRRL